MLEPNDTQIRFLCIKLLCDLYKIFSPSTRHSQRVSKNRDIDDNISNKDDICAGYVLQSLAEE